VDRYFIEVNRGSEGSAASERQLQRCLAYWRSGQEQAARGVLPKGQRLTFAISTGRYYVERPVALSAEDVQRRTEAIEVLVGVSQEAVAQVGDAEAALIAMLKAQQVRLIRVHAEEGDDVSPDAFRDERSGSKAEIDPAEESLAETEGRMILDAERLRMALRLAENVAEVYATADETTKRGYNQAFFKKLYIRPEWHEAAGETVAQSSAASWPTDLDAVLLADDSAEGVLVEVEAIRDRGAQEEDGPEGPPSVAGCSYFANLTERVGFEPTRQVNPAHAISSRAP
jgi:hypothetical protein